MTTLIILVIFFAIAIIGLIIISIKKFSDKTDYILASNAIVSSNITDNANKILELLDKIISDIDKGIKAEASNITNLLSVIDAANKTIMDSMDVSNRALVNSINAIEEKNDIIVKILEQITKFNENHRRVTEMLDNKIIDAKLKKQEISDALYNISDSIQIIRQNIEGSAGTKPELQKFNNKLIKFYEEINVIKQTLSNFDEVDCSRHQTIYDILKEIKNIAIDINNTTPSSEDIIDSDELVNRIAEGLYNKMNDLQAKNSSFADKVEKSSPAKSKHRTRAKKADNSYNSVHDPLQEKVNEDLLNQ